MFKKALSVMISILVLLVVYSCTNNENGEESLTRFNSMANNLDTLEINDFNIEENEDVGVGEVAQPWNWCFYLANTPYQRSSSNEWGTNLRVLADGVNLKESGGYYWEWDTDPYDFVDNWEPIPNIQGVRCTYLDGHCDKRANYSRFKIRVTATVFGETRTTNTLLVGADVCSQTIDPPGGCDAWEDSEYLCVLEDNSCCQPPDQPN